MAGCDDELAPHLVENFQTIDRTNVSGSGSFGSVYRVTVNGFPCIAKRLHDILVSQNVSEGERQSIRQRFRKECILLSKLRHPNIVQFIGVHYQKMATDDLTLIMERLYTDLEKCMNAHRNIPLPIQLSILLDVAYGLLYLHSENPPIIHRDVKAGNVLLTNDMRAKLADLGVSKILDAHPLSEVIRTVCPGTPGVMPPEALVEKPSYTTKLDDFSFGTLVLHVVNHEFPLPFETDEFERGKQHITKRRIALDKMGENHCLYPLVISCLQDDPEMRLITSQICSFLENLCKQYTKQFKDVLDMYETLSRFEAALHEANSQRRVVTEEERLAEKQVIIQTRERELKCALEEVLAARQEVQAKTAQVKQYKKQVDSLKAQVMELEKSNKNQSQEMKRLEKELQREVEKRKKAHPDRRFTASAPSQYSVSPMDGLERKIASLEKLNEELRNENDHLRRDTQATEGGGRPLRASTVQCQDSLFLVPPKPTSDSRPNSRHRTVSESSALCNGQSHHQQQTTASTCSPHDPNLVCRKCNKPFGSDEKEMFRHHVENCIFARLPLYQ